MLKTYDQVNKDTPFLDLAMYSDSEIQKMTKYAKDKQSQNTKGELHAKYSETYTHISFTYLHELSFAAGKCRLYFFMAAQIDQVAQPI